MVSREVAFATGGTLVVIGLIPISISILASFPTISIGLLINFGGLGVLLCLLGFYLIGGALFRDLRP